MCCEREIFPSSFESEEDGTLRLWIKLWPTAYRFLRDHRPGVQVSGDVHPRLARNTGSGEPLATVTELLASDREFLQDLLHPSTFVLNVLG